MASPVRKRLSNREIKTMLEGKSREVLDTIIAYHASKAAESQAIVAHARRAIKQLNKEGASNVNDLTGINSGFVADYVVKHSDSINVE